MPIERSQEYLISLVHELRKLPNETEWVEFKSSNDHSELIGEYISALANAAAFFGKVAAYMIWGIDDKSHAVIGTTFRPAACRTGNEELENWLLRQISPKILFKFNELDIDGRNVVLLEIGAAFRHPVQFKSTEFIRIGSYKKKLKDHPEKERELWRIFDKIPFEREVAAENIKPDEVIHLIDYPSYFDLLNLPLPESRDGIIRALHKDDMIGPGVNGKWNIFNLGAILFARKLSEFRNLQRKSIRVVIYKNNDRVESLREQEGARGYASGFSGLIDFILSLLPNNEVIKKALRQQLPMFPELAVRELVANALIHQDFHIHGTGPMVELFSNRMEITNPGCPLVATDQFLNSPPKSRNESVASFMRRIGVCEERGSGIDKVVSQTEFFQLPAPIFETTQEHTRSVLFSYRELKEMDKEDRIRACYLHACLKYVQRDFMTNASLRERFGISVENSAMASRIIKDSMLSGRIRCYDDSVGSRAKKYLPYWA